MKVNGVYKPENEPLVTRRVELPETHSPAPRSPKPPKQPYAGAARLMKDLVDKQNELLGALAELIKALKKRETE